MPCYSSIRGDSTANNDSPGEGAKSSVLLRNYDYDVVKAVLESISATSEAILLSQFKGMLKDDELLLAMSKRTLPYVSALQLLTFALKDKSKENLENVMSTIGLEFDEKVTDALSVRYAQNHLVYVYAFYFLSINGKETNEENLRALIEMLGLKFDRKTLEEALGFICSNTKCGRIQL
ncbi:Uncharacterised protein [uncultured archaeon]|nr:Uncharacterised protein [uncultured archaeon]